MVKKMKRKNKKGRRRKSVWKEVKVLDTSKKETLKEKQLYIFYKLP